MKSKNIRLVTPQKCDSRARLAEIASTEISKFFQKKIKTAIIVASVGVYQE